MQGYWKDVLNGNKGLERLKKQVPTAKLTKLHINNGYNKYLKLAVENKITIKKIMQGYSKMAWLKGYITNSTLNNENV